MWSLLLRVQEKYEWWWMYMCDAKKKQLLAGPMQICTLGDRDEVLRTTVGLGSIHQLDPSMDRIRPWIVLG